jgi:hypothetical protein
MQVRGRRRSCTYTLWKKVVILSGAECGRGSTGRNKQIAAALLSKANNGARGEGRAGRVSSSVIVTEDAEVGVRALDHDCAYSFSCPTIEPADRSLAGAGLAPPGSSRRRQTKPDAWHQRAREIPPPVQLSRTFI